MSNAEVMGTARVLFIAKGLSNWLGGLNCWVITMKKRTMGTGIYAHVVV
jgi:hypothetical protein